MPDRKLALFDATPASYSGGYEQFLISLCHTARGLGWDARIVRPPAQQFLSLTKRLGLGSRFAHIAGDRSPAENVDFATSATHVYLKNEPLDIAWWNRYRSIAKRSIGFHTPLHYPGSTVGVRLRNLIYANPVFGAMTNGANLHFLNKHDLEFFERVARGRRTAVIPNGTAARSSRSASPPFSIVFVGRLTPQKGLDRISPFEDPSLPQVDCIGAGPMLASLAQNRILRFLGMMPHERVIEELREHAILVMPSRWEGLPLTMLEAMSVGCVPIVQRLPALEEVLPQGYKWLAIDYDSSDALERTVTRLRAMHASHDSWLTIRDDFINHARSHFDEHTQLQKLLRFIGEGEAHGD